MFSPSVENLVAQLTHLPGVGTRTAQRLAFHLLRTSKDEALALAGAIGEVKERVRFCTECGNLTEEELCGICQDARRDRSLSLIKPLDVRVTRIASGLPVGGDLEYADEVTLGRALSGRREM